MKKKTILMSALVSITILACNHTKQNECITINNNGVAVISIEDIMEEGELKISDLARDFKIIRLETTDNCLIDHMMRHYVSDDYIIVSTAFKGIYLFSRDGSYIRTIAENGRGPGEVNDPNRNIEYDEVNKNLYVTNQMTRPPELLCFNIESGDYKKIELQYEGSIRDIVIIKDSVLIISTMPVRGMESDCPVFAQTVSGKILWEVNHTNVNGATNGGINMINDQIYFNYLWGDDTLFTLKNGDLTAHSVFWSDRNSYLPGKQESIGDILLGFRVINDELIKGSYSVITGFAELRGGQRPEFGDRRYFIYNYIKGTVYTIDKILDDFLGSEKSLRNPQKNGLYTTFFLPQDIIDLAEKLKDDPDVSEKVKERVLNLSEQITLNDNPILLVAKMK